MDMRSITEFTDNDKRYSENAEKRRSILNTLAEASSRKSRLFSTKRSKNEDSKEDFGKEYNEEQLKRFQKLQEIKDRVNTTVDEYEETFKRPTINKNDEELMREVEDHLIDIKDDMMRINISLLVNKYRQLQSMPPSYYGMTSSKENINEIKYLLSSMNVWFQDAMDNMDDSGNVVKTAFTSKEILQHSTKAVQKEIDRIEMAIRKIAYLKSKIQLNKLRGSSTLHLETTMGALQKRVQYALLHGEQLSSSIETLDDEEEKRNYFNNATDEMVELMKISRTEGYKESEAFRSKMNNYLRSIATKDEDIGVLNYKLLVERKAANQMKRDHINLLKQNDHLKGQILLQQKSHTNHEVQKQIWKERTASEKTNITRNDVLQQFHDASSEVEVDSTHIISPQGNHYKFKPTIPLKTTNTIKKEAKSKKKNSTKISAKPKQEEPLQRKEPKKDKVPKLDKGMNTLLNQMYKNFMDEKNTKIRQMQKDLLAAYEKLAKLENKDDISSYVKNTDLLEEVDSLTDMNEEILNYSKSSIHDTSCDVESPATEAREGPPEIKSELYNIGTETSELEVTTTTPEISEIKARWTLSSINKVTEHRSEDELALAKMLGEIKENRLGYSTVVERPEITYSRGTSTPNHYSLEHYEQNIGELKTLISDLWEENKTLQALVKKSNQSVSGDEVGEDRIQQETDQSPTQLAPNSPRNATTHHQQKISNQRSLKYQQNSDNNATYHQAVNKNTSQRPTKLSRPKSLTKHEPEDRDTFVRDRVGEFNQEEEEEEVSEEEVGEEMIEETDVIQPPPNSPTPDQQKVRQITTSPNKTSTKLYRQGKSKARRPKDQQEIENEAWPDNLQNDDYLISAVWAENSSNMTCKSTNEHTTRRSDEKKSTKIPKQLSRKESSRKSVRGLKIDHRAKKSENSDHKNFRAKSDLAQTSVKNRLSNPDQMSTANFQQAENESDVDVAAVRSLYKNDLLDVGTIQNILLKKGYLIKDQSNKVRVKNSDSNPPWVEDLLGDDKLITEILQANQTENKNTEDRKARRFSEQSTKNQKAGGFSEESTKNQKAGGFSEENTKTRKVGELSEKQDNSAEETKEEKTIKFDPNATITAMKMLEGAEPEELKETATSTIATLCVELEDVLEKVSGFFNHAQNVLSGQSCLMSKANDVLAQSAILQKDEKISSHQRALEEAHFGAQFGETTRKRLRGVERKIVGAIGDFMQACTSEVDEELQAYMTIRGLLGKKNIEQSHRKYSKSFDNAQDDMEDWIQNLCYRSQRERRQFWEKRKWLKAVQKHSKQMKEGWNGAAKYHSMNFFQVEPLEDAHHSEEQQTSTQVSKYDGRTSGTKQNEKKSATRTGWTRSKSNTNDEDEITSWEFLKVSSNQPKPVNWNYKQTNNDDLKKRYGRVDWLREDAYSTRRSSTSRRSSVANEVSNKRRYPIKNRPQFSPDSSVTNIKLESIKTIYYDRSIFTKNMWQTSNQILPAI